jgi:hypothetical protein
MEALINQRNSTILPNKESININLNNNTSNYRNNPYMKANQIK